MENVANIADKYDMGIIEFWTIDENSDRLVQSFKVNLENATLRAWLKTQTDIKVSYFIKSARLTKKDYYTIQKRWARKLQRMSK